MSRSAIITVALSCLSTAAAADTATEILALTGNKRTRIAWAHATVVSPNLFHGKANAFQLHGFDTDGGHRVILGAVDDYSKPLITHDGTRVVFSDRVERKVRVVDWGGTNLQTVASGFAGALWYDASTGKQWAYVQAGGDGSDRNLSGNPGYGTPPLVLVNVDNPGETAYAWTGENNALWLSVSSDAARVAGCWPWAAGGGGGNTCGAIAPNYSGGGSSQLVARGCWPTILPDATYRTAVFDGNHRQWNVFRANGSYSHSLTLNAGFGGTEIYHPKMSNHPQFMTMTGPYPGGIVACSPSAEVYFGKLNTAFTSVTGRVRVSSNTRYDAWPTAWVSNETQSARIDAFHADPAVVWDGESTTLSWQTTRTTSAAITPDVGAVPVNGSVEVSPTATTTYELVVQGSASTATRRVAVTVKPLTDDQIAPSITIDSPADGIERTGDITISGSASDNVGLDRVEVSIDGSDFALASGTASWAFNMVGSAYADGPHTVSVRAVDFAGNQAGDQVLVYTANAQSITLLSPVAGEVWPVGSIQTIRWQTERLSHVTISFSPDGGHTYFPVGATVYESDPEWGALEWGVPAAPTPDALIRVEGYFGEVPTESEPFTIEGAAATINIESPGTVTAGSSTTIVWTADGADAVVLEYSVDDGETWDSVGPVARSDSEWGAKAWVAPNVSSPACRLRAYASPLAVGESERFVVVAIGGVSEPLRVDRITITGTLPDNSDARTVQVSGRTATVNSDRTFSAAIGVPQGVERFVFGIQADEFERFVSVSVEADEAPIPGLAVSASDIRAFLDGRRGVLTWALADGGLEVLDLRDHEPRVQRVEAAWSAINPILSPDGTRVLFGDGHASGSRLLRGYDLRSGDLADFGAGDTAYWHTDGASESVVSCDWTDKASNGDGGNTYLQPLTPGTVMPDGERSLLHDRAMDAGPNGALTWLGQVYGQLSAYDVINDREFGTEQFQLMDGSVADHQTCNGSMAPDDSGRLMTLVIPHDWVRIFSHQPGNDSFVETSRFSLPAGMVEWEFPEWSTDPAFFTAILRTASLENRLAIVRIVPGELVPEVLIVTGDERSPTYSHLYVEQP